MLYWRTKIVLRPCVKLEHRISNHETEPTSPVCRPAVRRTRLLRIRRDRCFNRPRRRRDPASFAGQIRFFQAQDGETRARRDRGPQEQGRGVRDLALSVVRPRRHRVQRLPRRQPRERPARDDRFVLHRPESGRRHVHGEAGRERPRERGEKRGVHPAGQSPGRLHQHRARQAGRRRDAVRRGVHIFPKRRFGGRRGRRRRIRDHSEVGPVQRA